MIHIKYTDKLPSIYYEKDFYLQQKDYSFLYYLKGISEYVINKNAEKMCMLGKFYRIYPTEIKEDFYINYFCIEKITTSFFSYLIFTEDAIEKGRGDGLIKFHQIHLYFVSGETKELTFFSQLLYENFLQKLTA